MDDGDGGWDLLGALFYLFFTDAVILHRDAGDEVPPRYLPHLLGPLLVLLALMLLLLALPAQIPEALTQVCDDGCMLFNLHLNPSGVHFDLLG